jgi:hypothetical protein
MRRVRRLGGRKLGVAAMVLGAMIPVIGVATSLEMARFDLDHGRFDAVESAAFLQHPIQRRDLLFYRRACCAFWWPRRPEIHRRMTLLATCLLTPAAFARFPFITITALRWYTGVDALLLLAVARDIWPGRGVHRAYAISLPLVVSGCILHDRLGGSISRPDDAPPGERPPQKSIARCPASATLIAEEACVVWLVSAIVTDRLTSVGSFGARMGPGRATSESPCPESIR